MKKSKKRNIDSDGDGEVPLKKSKKKKREKKKCAPSDIRRRQRQQVFKIARWKKKKNGRFQPEVKVKVAKEKAAMEATNDEIDNSCDIFLTIMIPKVLRGRIFSLLQPTHVPSLLLEAI